MSGLCPKEPIKPRMITPSIFISFYLWGATILFTVLATASCSTVKGGVEQRIAAELLKQAEADGSVRVIVELRVGPQGIHAAQDEVLKALQGTPHRVTRRYTQVPFLGLEVSPQALQILSTSPAVLRIQEDQVVAPQRDKTP